MFTRSDFAALDGFRFERFDLPNGIVLFVQRSTRFKTLVVEAFIHSHLSDQPTHTALVPHVLRRGCARYPNAPKLVQRLNFLYGAALSTDIAKIGEQQILTLRLEFVSDRFLPRKGNLRNGVQFLSDVILRPLVVGAGFSPRYVNTEKTNLRRFIESLIDDRATYAAERCIQEMCKDEPYGIYEHGRLADIDAIDGKQLLSWHRALTRRNPIHFFVAGNVDPDEVRRVVESAFSFKRGKPVQPAATIADSRPCTSREVHEKADIDQGKLVIGYRTGVTLRDDGMYAMTFFNGLFGGLSHSRLFRVVREKAGLAYYVHSALERTKGIMLVGAGIDSAKYGEALRLVRQSLEDIAAGKIEDWEMDATRESLVSHLKSLDDSPSVKISSYVERLINGRVLSFEGIYDALTCVTKADVAAAASKVKEDTVYFLSELDRSG